MKPKEALVKDGFLPAGAENKRGRLSADAIERCKVLVAQGVKIEGYEMSHSTVPMETAGALAAQVNKVKIATGEKTVSDIPDQIRPESEWEAYANVDSKIVNVGMRTVCNTCHHSLTYCPCKTPVVNLDYDRTALVNFRLRTKPLNGRFW